MKQTVEDDKVKDKISEDEIKTISDKCSETIQWLDANQTAEKVRNSINILFTIFNYRTSSNTRRRNSRRSAPQSSPRCTRVLVVLPVVCQVTQLFPNLILTCSFRRYARWIPRWSRWWRPVCWRRFWRTNHRGGRLTGRLKETRLSTKLFAY